MAVPYLLLVSLYLWEEIFQQLMLYCLAILIVTLNKRTSMQSAFCINRHYKITKRHSVFCQVALEGPPPMRKRRSKGEDMRTFVFEDGNWQTVYLYWLNWHLSLNKLPPCQPNFKIGAIKSIDTPPALHIQTVLYYDQFNLGNINKCTNSKTIPI